MTGVDATKLHEHTTLGSELFSRIVFNFPHVGGKMKINLNRNLLVNFLHSAVSILAPDGKILVTLCRGQGGTPADKPHRRWDDSWKIVEMAAQNSLIVEAVETFPKELFSEYECVGYKSLEKGFHTEGALVHVLKIRDHLFPVVADDILLDYLKLEMIDTPFGTIQCSCIYTRKYKTKLVENVHNPVYYVCKRVLSFFEQEDQTVTYVTDKDVPLFVQSDDNCETSLRVPGTLIPSGKSCCMRRSLLDVREHLLKIREDRGTEVLVYPGAVFVPLSEDFKCAPVRNELLFLGCDAQNMFTHCIVEMFQELQPEQKLEVRECNDVLNSESCNCSEDIQCCNITTVTMDSNVTVQIAKMQKFQYNDQWFEACLVNVDGVVKILFDLQNWRPLWADGSYMKHNKFYPASLYPVVYTYDICFWEGSRFKESKFYDILWHIAGDIIIEVSLLNTYTLPEDGRKTRCYRILYQSFEKPLWRKKAIDIHQNVIGRVLELGLGVVIK